jgi:nitroimidazol reductase NimA-like FMN-containing flavoprotein (pyridoxamine 5'-phosphate oxidase superfamily)/DNA-binding XRE family transcriptional regulator
MNTTAQHHSTDGIAARVRQRRLALGLSRADVAQRSGLSLKAIERIETQPVALPAGELMRIVHALDTTLSELVPSEAVHEQARTLGPARPTLEGMAPAECLAMLRRGGVGRIAYNVAGHLAVVPVNFGLHTGMIMFRTAEDSTIAQYSLEPVAFEVDRIDEETHEGWSVLVNGTLRPATDDEAAVARRLVEPWAGGKRETCMVIEPGQLSGRRLRAW